MSTIQENWKVDADGQVVNEEGKVIAGNITNINNSFLISKIPELCRQLLQAQNQLNYASQALSNKDSKLASLYINATSKDRLELIEKINNITEVENLT